MGVKASRPALPALCAAGHHRIQDDPHREKLPGIVSDIIDSLKEEDSPDHVGFPMIPDQDSLVDIVRCYMTLIMPGYFGDQMVDKTGVGYYIGNQVDRFYRLLQEQVGKCFIHECKDPRAHCTDCQSKGAEAAVETLRHVSTLRKRLASDIRAAYDGDPAAKNMEEIIFCYPGLKAVIIYRLAHVLHGLEVPILPRMLTEHAHSLTGCDIHPGAQIGDAFFIDHATGVVIGETAIIGDRVRLYQGVTLGGADFRKDEHGRLIRDSKRHPTIEDDCIIYAGAVILGGETVVGKGSVIGGSVWLTHSVPPNSKVTLNSQGPRKSSLDEGMALK